jgi:hypothetical protein
LNIDTIAWPDLIRRTQIDDIELTDLKEEIYDELAGLDWTETEQGEEKL